MNKVMPQLIRAFSSEGLGAAEKFVWRIIGEPTQSELGSPSVSGETVDTIVEGIFGTSTIDDSYIQTQTSGLMSSGKKIVHLRPDISLYHGQRTLLAGDLFYRYAEDTLSIIVEGAETKAYIRPEAIEIVMTMTYDNVTRLLTDSDYTYDAVAGTVAFIVSIPVNAAIACSYYYDKYIIEDVNNYGKVYIEVILNKISET